MTQFNSFEQTKSDSLHKHLCDIDALYQSKLEELRSIAAVKAILLAVIGEQAMHGVLFGAVEQLDPPIADVA